MTDFAIFPAIFDANVHMLVSKNDGCEQNYSKLTFMRFIRSAYDVVKSVAGIITNTRAIHLSAAFTNKWDIYVPKTAI